MTAQPIRRVRRNAWIGLVFACFLAWTAGPASARQERPADPDPTTSASPESLPEDPWDRATPRDSVLGFLTAARDGRWEDAAQFLDLRKLPAAERDVSGPELARQLKYVLDRKLWIDLESLSDRPEGSLEDGQAQRDQVGTIPHDRGDFDVFLERISREGDPAAIWQFSAGTVARAPLLYDETGLGPILERLPKALTTKHFLDTALWQWIALTLLVVLGWLAAWVLAMLFARVMRPLTQRSHTDIDDRLVELAIGPMRMLATLGIFFLGSNFLMLSAPARAFTREVTKFLIIAGLAWLVIRLIDLVAGIVRMRLTDRGLTGAVYLIPLGARAIKVAVAAMALLAALDTFGFDVTAVIAGLGVGGLAVALAAQKTFENVFGGISVLVDQPVRPGDFCKFGDQVGTVEEIGLRSTRIRTLDRTVVTIPNGEFSNLHLENYAKRDRIRLLTTLGLRYETTPDQLRHVIAGLRRILVAHPKVLPDPLRVRFTGFGAYSLDLEVFAYVETMDFNEFLAVREDIFLHMMDVVAESGTGFAFPSSTNYFVRDQGLDPERQKAVEAEVEEWRAGGKLMFPDFTPEELARMEGTLEWPPRGSAAAKRG